MKSRQYNTGRFPAPAICTRAAWSSNADEAGQQDRRRVELFLEATQALNRIFDRVDPFLKDDLLRGMFELLVGQPAPMRHRPVAASAVNPAVPQQEGKQLLALATKIVSRGLPGADKIAHSFVGGVRCPHARQFAGPSSRASVTASRRFVLIRSPDRFGIRAGATTMHSWPSAWICR